MIDYIIPIFALSILIVGAIYKVINHTNDDDFIEPKKLEKDHKKNVPNRVINDHIAEVMNIKKKK